MLGRLWKALRSASGAWGHLGTIRDILNGLGLWGPSYSLLAALGVAALSALAERPPELIFIFAMIAGCLALFLATFFLQFVRAWRHEVSEEATVEKSSINHPPSQVTVEDAPKLELVYRIGEPFLEEEGLSPQELDKTQPRVVEKLIGVRNVSSGHLRNVSVQVASVSQATGGLPFTLPYRDGLESSFALAPGEMRLVRFIRQEARSGQPLRMGTFGGDAGGPFVLAPCEVALAAYAVGASTFMNLSLSTGDDGELQISPPRFGELPGGVQPEIYLRLSIGPVRKRSDRSVDPALAMDFRRPPNQAGGTADDCTAGEQRRQDERRVAAFGIDDQKRLAERLKSYLKPSSHAEFKFASLKQMELTETIESIFTMAGWETNYWNIPVESHRSVHLEGIEVFGHNKFLVNAVVSEMRDAGLPAVRSKVEPVESPMNAERWASLENRLRITVGHH